MLRHARLGVGLLFAVLPLHILSAKVTKPRVKWGQNKNSLYVSILVRDLDDKSVSVTMPSEGDLSFKAKSAKGEDFAIDMPLREDVKIESMKWEIPARPDKWGTAVLVTLEKVNQHRWDLLVAEPKAFKGLIDKDWSREDQTLEPEEEAPYLEDHSGYLVALSAKTYNKTVAKYNAVIVNVRYPWCTQCKSQDDTFAKAAKAAKARAKKDKTWKQVAFGVVDAREERKLGRSMGAKCSYDCDYRVASPGEDPIPMKSKWSQDDLLNEVKKYLGPAVEKLKDVKEADTFKEKNTTFVGGFASEASPAYSRFKRVANILRGQLIFAASFGEDRQLELWPHKQNFSFKFDGTADDNGTELLAWVKPRSIPLLQPYDWQLRETYEGLGLPLAKIWIDDSDKNPSMDKVVRHAVRRVAKKFIGKLAFVEQKKSTYSYELRDYGLNKPEVYPAFGIASNASYNSVKYGFEVTEAVASSVQEFWKDADKAIPVLTDFCEKMLAGTWPEAHESDWVHSNWTKGSLKRLVWKSYAEVKEPEKPLLLTVYGKYRAENEKKIAEASNLAEALASHAESFTVASFDTSDNHLPPADFKRDKYSSDTEWYWIPAGPASDTNSKQQLLKPKKDAPIKTVIEFLKKQSGLELDVDSTMKRFEDLMVEKPPVTTTLPPMPKGGRGGVVPEGADEVIYNRPGGGMGGMEGMGDIGGMGGLGGMGDLGGMGMGDLGGKDDL